MEQCGSPSPTNGTGGLSSSLEEKERKKANLIVSQFLNNYDVKEYFSETKHPLERSVKQIEFCRIDPKVITKLSSKLQTKPLELIGEGPKVLEEKMKGTVYSAAQQLEEDTVLIQKGEDLKKEIQNLKKDYQNIIHDIQKEYPFAKILDYKNNHNDYSQKWSVLEGRLCDLEKEVAERVKKDKMKGEPSQVLIGSFAARYQMDPLQVLTDLKTFCSNTVTISKIPTEITAAIADAKKIVPNFCYYFCYLCYLCSEEIPHWGPTEANFLFWFNLGWYNFVDNELMVNLEGKLEKMEKPDHNKPKPPKPSYFFSDASDPDINSSSL